MATTEHVQLKGAVEGRAPEVLTPEALAFVAKLQREFAGRRQELLRLREERQRRLDAGETPQFLVTTSSVRDSDWQVAKVPNDLQDRRVEITGPTDRKMVINALNSGAKVFMTDFERIPAVSRPGADNERTGDSTTERFGHTQRDLPGLRRLRDGPWRTGSTGRALPSPAGRRWGKRGARLVYRNYRGPDDDIGNRHLTTTWVTTGARTGFRL